MAQLATDDFNRANGALGANYATPSSLVALTISSNAVTSGTASDADGAAAYTGAGAISLSQYAQAAVPTVGNYFGLILRANTNDDMYILVCTASDMYVYSMVAGSFTLLSSVSQVIANGDTVYFEVQSTTIISKVNGVTKHNFTNSAVNGSSVGGPYPGIYAANTSIRVDNFAMGDFAAAGGGILQQMMNYH